MPPSSTEYSTYLEPQSRLRRLVLVSGVVAGIVGQNLLLILPFSPGWLWLCSAAWLTLWLAEVVVIRRCYRCVAAYELFSDGRILLADARNRRTEARMAAGSMVLAGVAWIRVCTHSGASWGELLSRQGHDSEDWRRLQVICRHQ